MNFPIKSGFFTDFTYNGQTVAIDTSFSPTVNTNASQSSVYLSGITYRYSFSAPSLSSFTYELQEIINNSVVVTSGEIDATRTLIGSSYYRYAVPVTTTTRVQIINPYHDFSIYTLRTLIRINGTIAKTVDLQFVSLPVLSNSNGFSISFSSPSSPQTGKIGTITIQRNSAINTFAKVYQITSKFFTYRKTVSPSQYNYESSAYINNGLTRVYDYIYNDYLSSFSCNYYVPYYPNFSHVDNNSTIGFYLIPDVSAFSNYNITQTNLINGKSDFYVVNYSVAFSYINQSDSNAAPTIGNVSISESPSGISTTYGRYVGGGITTLTFTYENVTYRYGASFEEVTYEIYNSSSGTLVKSLTSQSESNFSYLLENETDITYYLDVQIKSTLLVAGTYRYNNIQTYGYVPPSIISFNASRCNQDETPNDAGAYCKITYQFRVIALGNHNSKEVTLTAPDGSHVYTNLDYDHGSPYQYISAADIEHSYLLTITIEDDFVTVSASRNLSTAGVIMDFLYDGKGIGLGKVAETTQMVEVNPDWTFKADKITFKGEDLESILTSLGYVFPT